MSLLSVEFLALSFLFLGKDHKCSLPWGDHSPGTDLATPMGKIGYINLSSDHGKVVNCYG